MKRVVRCLTLLLLFLTTAVSGRAQQSVKHGLNKSLMGIEVHFRWDDSRLDLDYMGNRQTFRRFAHVIDSIGIHHIDSVVIVSQSSPEGVYEHNLRLSQRRAATMRRAIMARHPELEQRLFVHPEGESWGRLREYVINDKRMKQSTIDQVVRIIDSDVNIGTKKWRLAQLPIYRYLLMTYYPRIRNSVFCIIYFDEPIAMAAFDEPITEIALMDTLPELPLQITAPREPALGIHTNLLNDLGTVLNVGFEYYPRHSRWTIAGNYTFPWWSHDASHHYFQLLDWELEARYYLKKSPLHYGHYFAAYGHYNLYDFSFNAEDAWQGEGRGAGISYGYVWLPWQNKRWKVEAHIRFGFYETRFDPYHASDPFNGKYYHDWFGMPDDFISRNHRLRWLGPTGAGITLRYDLITRKVKPRTPRNSR